jgi:hypothetical protein
MKRSRDTLRDLRGGLSQARGGIPKENHDIWDRLAHANAQTGGVVGFGGFDVMENDSAFHRAKLAQGDKGIDSGQQKMRPVIFPTLPEGL